MRLLSKPVFGAAVAAVAAGIAVDAIHRSGGSLGHLHLTPRPAAPAVAAAQPPAKPATRVAVKELPVEDFAVPPLPKPERRDAPLPMLVPPLPDTPPPIIPNITPVSMPPTPVPPPQPAPSLADPIIHALELPVSLSPEIAPARHAPPAAPPAPSGVDELLAQLTRLREKKADLERQEQDVAKQLRQRLREQQEKLRKLGVGSEEFVGPQPAPPSAIN